MAQWLVLLPHSEKALVQNLAGTSLCEVLLVHVWVYSVFSQSKEMVHRLFIFSNFFQGAIVSVNGLATFT